MDGPVAPPEQDELEALERERTRIEDQLRTPGSPTIEAMLLDERRWVMRRKREFERIPVSSRGALRFGGAAHPCHVRDVSGHGAGVDTDAQLLVGEEVQLVLTDLEGAPALDAVVRHVTRRRVGLEFVRHRDAARAAADQLTRWFRATDR